MGGPGSIGVPLCREAAILPPTITKGRKCQWPPQGSGQSGCSLQDGSSGPRLSLETQCPLEPGKVGGRVRAREPSLLLEDGRQSFRYICRHVLGIAGGIGQRGLNTAGPPEGWCHPTLQPRLTLPGRSRRPGGPAAPTPAARAPGAGVARTPSASAGQSRGECVPHSPASPSATPTCSREKAVTRVRQPFFSSSFHSASQ